MNEKEGIQFHPYVDQNCSRCHSFGSCVMKSDYGLIMPQEQKIMIVCKKHGSIENNKMYICGNFEYDFSKPEIVYNYRKATYQDIRFFVRMNFEQTCGICIFPEKKRLFNRSEGGLTVLQGLIMQLIEKVALLHNVNSYYPFVSKRIEKETCYHQSEIEAVIGFLVQKDHLEMIYQDGFGYLKIRKNLET